MLALMHLATTAWLACLPSRCVPAPRLAYCSCAARHAVASSSQIGDCNVGRCSPLEGESSTPPRRRTRPGPQGPGFLLGADDGGQTSDDGKGLLLVLPRFLL